MVKGQIKANGTHKSERQAIKDWPVTERPREKLLQLVARFRSITACKKPSHSPISSFAT
jgi:hypothetical protein